MESCVAPTLGDSVGDDVTDGVDDALRVWLGVSVDVGDTLPVPVCDGVHVVDALTLAVGLAVGEAVGECVGDHGYTAGVKPAAEHLTCSSVHRSSYIR